MADLWWAPLFLLPRWLGWRFYFSRSTGSILFRLLATH